MLMKLHQLLLKKICTTQNFVVNPEKPSYIRDLDAKFESSSRDMSDEAEMRILLARLASINIRCHQLG